MTEQKKSLAEIAKKQRYLYLVENLQKGKTLTKQEIAELEKFEAEPLPSMVVQTYQEVAKVLEVSIKTVQRWKKEGMPVTKDGYYDLEQVKEWQIKRIEESKKFDKESKAYWDQKLLRGKVEKIEFEIKQMRGALVPKEDVEQERVARIMAVKRAFLALPTALAPTLAMKEPREIQTTLYEVIGEIIDDFAGVRKIKKNKKKNS
jgi:phage terminase Nu1 subunit (DNA packaging protein)